MSIGKENGMKEEVVSAKGPIATFTWAFVRLAVALGRCRGWGGGFDPGSGQGATRSAGDQTMEKREKMGNLMGNETCGGSFWN